MTHTPLRPAHTVVDAPENDLHHGDLHKGDRHKGEAPKGDAHKGGRAKWPWIAGGVLTVLMLGAGGYAYAASGGGDDPKPVAAPVAQVRTAAEDTFAFVVGEARCGVPAVGPAELTQRAKGEFCLVDVTVKNTGTESDLLDTGAQRAIDGQGRAYPVADDAVVFLNDTTPSLLDEIKPGVGVHGTLAFDVPAGTKLAALVLHRSIGSAGVRVPLS
jgi:uncharacterized protein DUF4352